jgi:DNA mismatch endonuclease (patch repair protein)
MVNAPKARYGPQNDIDELTRRVMRSNKSSGNLSTELRLIKLMRANGIRGWRRGVTLRGRPDFVFRQERLVVFVDGCFWHGCKCRKPPTLNREFWEEKFRSNRARDRRITRELRLEGWKVIRIWEHDLRIKPQVVLRRLSRVAVKK